MRIIVLLISVALLSTSACRTGQGNRKLCLVMGNSTIATFGAYAPVAQYMRADTSINRDFYICDISHSGDRIAAQQTLWLNMKDKKSVDIVFIQIGLNDLYPPNTTQSILKEYKSLIDTIRASGKPDLKIAAATMVPCKQFWLTKMGTESGIDCFRKWEEINDAIMARGDTPLPKIDYRIEKHTMMLSDSTNNLKPRYNSSDFLHENNLGRELIASVYAEVLVELYGMK